MNIRPTPGTAELLEVLDRALSGGIIIDLGSDPVGLEPGSTEGRMVVAAAETCLGHVNGPTGLSLMSPAKNAWRQQ